jgi:hypothetical protein
MAKPMHITGMLCTNSAPEAPYYHNRPEFPTACSGQPGGVGDITAAAPPSDNRLGGAGRVAKPLAILVVVALRLRQAVQ